MSDETEIEILPHEASAAKASAGDPKPRKRFGLAVLLGAVFLSSVFGAGVIWLASHFNKTPIPDLSPLQTKIETISSEAQSLAAENKTLKAQFARLQRDVKGLPKAKSVDMSGLETRLKRLEDAEPQAIDSDLITRLEALKSKGSEALDLSDILSRIEALESRPIATPSMTKFAAIEDVRKSISFPSEAVLARLEKTDGWLKKSLKKHISVQSDDNPRYLVELINTHIEVGDIEAAIAAFDKLPPEAKAAGKAWRESLNR